MSTEETVTNVGQADTEQPSTDSAAATGVAPSQSVANSEDSATAVATQRETVASQNDEEHESRAADQDFGELMDKFEQEQSSLQEGQVVRGTGVCITGPGVVIEFGYKSEGVC